MNSTLYTTLTPELRYMVAALADMREEVREMCLDRDRHPAEREEMLRQAAALAEAYNDIYSDRGPVATRNYYIRHGFDDAYFQPIVESAWYADYRIAE